MQDASHRQDPILSLVPIRGEGKSVEELEREALVAILRDAEEGLTSLSGSGSTRLRFLQSVQSGAASLLADSPTSRALPG